jgi:hypothetical protein
MILLTVIAEMQPSGRIFGQNALMQEERFRRSIVSQRLCCTRSVR